jgi:hypothetical protein
MLPWLTLPRHLAKSGLVIQNYPAGVRFPGNQHSKKKSKGITDLNTIEQNLLLKSIKLTSKNRLRIVAVPEVDSQGR